MKIDGGYQDENQGGSTEQRAESNVSFDSMLCSAVKFAGLSQVCSFDVKYCSKSAKYISWTSKYRVIIFIAWNLLVSAYILWSAYNRYHTSNLTNLDFWLTIITHALWGLCYALSLYSMWNGGQGLVELLNAGRIREKSFQLQAWEVKRNVLISRLSSFRWAMSILTVTIMLLFFSNTHIEDFYENDTGSLFLKLFEDLMQLCNCVQDMGIKYTAFSVSLIAWVHVNTSLLAVTSPKLNHLEQILDVLDGLIRMFDLLNNVFGYIVFSTMVGMIPFYSSRLQIMFSGPFEMQLGYALYTLNFCLIGGFAGGANSAMNNFPEVIKERLKSGMRTNAISLQRLQIVLHQLQGGVGVRAKIFIVTWTWLGQIASMVVTFGMILSQLGT